MVTISVLQTNNFPIEINFTENTFYTVLITVLKYSEIDMKHCKKLNGLAILFTFFLQAIDMKISDTSGITAIRYTEYIQMEFNTHNNLSRKFRNYLQAAEPGIKLYMYYNSGAKITNHDNYSPRNSH